MALQSLNPATGQLVASFEEWSPAQVRAAVEKADAAFSAWRQRAISSRGRLLLGVRDILLADKAGYGRLLTEEMGKPIKQAVAEIEKCAWACEYYAAHAARLLKKEKVATDASDSFVRFDPLGTVLAVMPWNFPFWQVFRFAAPALMAGNVCLLKHASNVPRCALRIEEIFKQAGFPEGVFQTLLVGAGAVEEIIAQPQVRAVTLTGSDRAGRLVAEAAGRHLKKCVLELGGSDPFIVLEDADLEACARQAVNARIVNNGQSCIAAKRFIVLEKVIQPFGEAFVALMRQVKVGDPLDETNDLGPLARPDLVSELDRQVKESLRCGARLLAGGEPLAGPGFYYPATVLADVKPGMPAFAEELFGPVAALIAARDNADALRLANLSPFGLGASLWTRDLEKAKRLAAEIESGMVFVNGMVKSDPRLPFGGVKASGYGRELSHYGIKEFVNIKTVWVGP